MKAGIGGKTKQSRRWAARKVTMVKELAGSERTGRGEDERRLNKVRSNE